LIDVRNLHEHYDDARNATHATQGLLRMSCVKSTQANARKYARKIVNTQRNASRRKCQKTAIRKNRIYSIFYATKRKQRPIAIVHTAEPASDTLLFILFTTASGTAWRDYDELLINTITTISLFVQREVEGV